MTHLFIIVCSVLSTVLGLYSVVPYVRAIRQGKTHPHQFSWLIFTLMSGITVLSQLLEGARASVIIFAVFFVNQLIILLFSFKYGVRGTSRFDRILFAAAILTIVLWALTRSNELAIWLTVLIDIFATSMTVLKIRHHPSSEAVFPWVTATLACVFNCLTLVTVPFGILYVRPVYALLSEAVVVLAIYVYRPAASA